jgi:hypothetical protein
MEVETATVKTTAKKPRKLKSPKKTIKPKDKIYMDELCELAEVETVDELDALVFGGASAKSIRPMLMFQSGIPDDMFYALNYPYIRHAYFTAQFR